MREIRNLQLLMPIEPASSFWHSSSPDVDASSPDVDASSPDPQGHTYNCGKSCSAEGRGRVCMGVFQARTDIFQEFWERTERGLVVIWPGESALFPFGEDRLWIPFLAV